MEREVFDRMREIDGHHWWFVARRRIVRQLLERHAKGRRDLRILEVGCGTGSNLPMLSEFGAVEGLEPDPEAREVACKRFGFEVRGGLLPDQIELEDGRYDLIVLLDVLEHVRDDVAALSALRTKLAPGGAILVTVPAMPWLWSAHDTAHHHHRRYTSDHLTRSVTAGGFELLHRTHFNSLLFPLIAAVRGLGKLLGRDGGDDQLPPLWANRLLTWIFSLERAWVSRISVPIGISLAAIVRPAPAPSPRLS